LNINKKRKEGVDDNVSKTKQNTTKYNKIKLLEYKKEVVEGRAS
jgi:hypothetical protein